MKRSLIVLSCLLCLLISAQGQLLPKPSAPAPKLTYTQLLQAPEGAKTSWRALRGRVVVLEFWATWCAPCVAEIPVLNQLADSLDPRKVQFIAIDDEDPAVVKAFLKRRPMSGWVMLDTSGAVFKQFGVASRPTTIVIDTKGRVVSTTTRPEHLQRNGLLQLAMGKPAAIEGNADAKTDAEVHATLREVMTEQTGQKIGIVDPLFSLSIMPGNAAQMTHVFFRGTGVLDVMNATPDTLLMFALGIPADRIKVNGELAKTAYSLHLHAPSTDAEQLAQAIEVAIQSSCEVRVERRTTVRDVYVLEAADKARGLSNLSSSPHEGFAFYSKQTRQMQLLNASVDQVSGALEQVLERPVVNGSGVSGNLTVSFMLPSSDFDSVKAALEKNTGLILVAAKRPIETILLTPNPKLAKAPAKPAS